MKPIPAKAFGEKYFSGGPGQAQANGLVIFLAICAILYMGRNIIIPMVLAVLLSMLLAPCVRLLKKLGIPNSAAILLTVIVAFGGLFAGGYVVANTLTGFATDLPQYERTLREKAKNLKSATSGGDTIDRAANVLKDLQNELEKPDAGEMRNEVIKPVPVELHDSSYGPLAPLIAVMALLLDPLVQIGIIILMVIFILFNREDLRNRVLRLAGTGDIHRTTIALDEGMSRLTKLFASQLLLNAATGTLIGVALAFVGIPGAILWGVLAAVMRFIPYIGALFASLLPIIIAAAISDGWTLVMITAGIALAAEIIFGQIIEPMVFGKASGLSAVAVVASAAFWAALWGPIGLILAMPLTIGLLVVGRHIEALSFLDTLLGSDEVLTPDGNLYQRLLAKDPIEAAQLARDYAKEGSLESFLNEAAIPALLLANQDQRRGVLSRETEASIAQTFSEMLDEVWDEDEVITPEKPARIVLVSAHGYLNFAATLAFSAFLKLRAVPHTVLPQDSISPGKFPQLADEAIDFVCLCYLVSPSEAQNTYLLRRLKTRLKQAKLISVAWTEYADRDGVHSPTNAVALFPAIQAVAALQ